MPPPFCSKCTLSAPRNAKPRNRFACSLKCPTTASPKQAQAPSCRCTRYQPIAGQLRRSVFFLHFVVVAAANSVGSPTHAPKTSREFMALLPHHGGRDKSEPLMFCLCRQGRAKPLSGTKGTELRKHCKCYVHVKCSSDGSCLHCAQPTIESPPLPYEVCAVHISWQSRKHEKWDAICRAVPQLAARSESIPSIANMKWAKAAEH